MARWITVGKSFDYHWPGRSAVTAFKEQGGHLVKDEVADFAVGRGYATEGKVDASSRSRKGKRVRKEKPAAADAGTVPPVGDEGSADDDRSADRPAMDQDAG